METDARTQSTLAELQVRPALTGHTPVSVAPPEWNNREIEGGTWRSSTLRGREEILYELREFVPDARGLFVRGPRGAGTTALAREYVSLLRNQLNGRDSVVIRVDVSAQNCPSGDPSYGVAAALLRHFQQDAPVQGASRQRIMWWFLRRVVVEERPVIVWLDQVRPNVRSLSGVLGPLMDPGTLVEDARDFPPVFLVLSGNGDGGVAEGVKRVRVPPLPVGTIREIVEDRTRQSGHILAPDALTKVMDILATRGNSLSVMGEILQAAIQRAGCHGIIVEGDVVPPSSRTCPRTGKRMVELRVLEVLRRAGGRLPMGELVQHLARSFTSEGERTPSHSNVRRWAVRMQALGLVKRSVTQGGEGGTVSVVSLVPVSFPSPPR